MHQRTPVIVLYLFDHKTILREREGSPRDAFIIVLLEALRQVCQGVLIDINDNVLAIWILLAFFSPHQAA